MDRLIAAVRDVKEQVTYCSICNNITDSDPCRFCRDESRDHAVICVVEEPQNVSAVEKSREFKGTYHVLMGALSPLQGVGPDDLKIKSLLTRLSNGVTEVILATNPNVDGEATAIYLARLLNMCARLRDAHLPGARFTWEPMTHMPASTHARVVAARPLIRRIFSEASRAPNPETRASESRATGRFIFSGAWWRGGFRRDYYFEESKDGGLQWMYYDHRRKRAFLQGDVE